ncbi:MAG: 50S ribosomal protein L23 [Lentisphaerae bacterium]|nr:50S ribosomal protein L23 [Lentisphaerota bacterium]
MNNAFDVIIAPVVTEKCNALMQEKKYTFKVNPKAGRIEIARAVEELFKVKVAKVNVMNYQGKAKRAGRTMKMGRRADWKRAVVTLAEGSIEII